MFLSAAKMGKNCSSCKNYLSVKPLHQYANGDIRCGRCVRSNDGGSPVWLSDVSEDALFPCIYHYDGCRRLLKPWEVTRHEIECTFKTTLICPFCPSNGFQLTSLFLLQHLKEDHADFVLNNPKVTITLPTPDRKDCYIYYGEEFIFLVNVCIFPERIEISFGSICTSGIDIRQISTNVILCSRESKTEVNFEPLILPENPRVKKFVTPYFCGKVCGIIDLKFRINRLFSPDFAVQQNSRPHLYPKIVKSVSFDLSGCRTVIMLPNGNIPSFCNVCNVSFYQKTMYKCKTGKHYICGACRYFDIEECEDGKRFVEAIEEESIIGSLRFCCKWDCNFEDRFSFINCHEIQCDNQPIIMCPVSSCLVFGTLRAIFDHYQSRHSHTNIKLYDYWNAPSGVSTGVFILKDIQIKQEWHYYVSNLFVTIKSEENDEQIKFFMEICNENVMDLCCCALIKYGEQHGRLEKNTFSIPKTEIVNNKEQNLCVRLFLRRADFALPGFIKNGIN